MQDYFKKSPSQQAQDYASDTYNAAGSKAQGAYDSVKGAASDASARAGDASGRAQRNAKGTQQAAAGKAGQAYDAAADSANRASGKAGASCTDGGWSTQLLAGCVSLCLPGTAGCGAD